MKIVYFWLTPQGKALAEKIQNIIGGEIEPKENFSETVKRDFYSCDALVFITSAGIAVRSIAPLIKSKTTDPAVVVLDHKGKYAVSLLSGHLGGANKLARKIANAIKAEAVITTATDTEGIISFDEIAKTNGLVIENISELKYISGAMLEGKSVELITDIPIADNEINSEIILTQNPVTKYRVRITDRIIHKEQGIYTLFLRPAVLTVGIGCKKNIDADYLDECFEDLLKTNNFSRLSVKQIATITLKSQEPAILKLCEKYNIPLKIVSNEEILASSYPFERSEFVEKTTGLPSVAEASSYIASGNGEILTGKVKYSGVTMALCRSSHPKIFLKQEVK